MTQFLTVSLLTLILNTLFCGLLFYFLTLSSVQDQLDEKRHLLQTEIRQKLKAGWVPQDLDKILHKLNVAYPKDKFFFIPDVKFDTEHRQLLSSDLQKTLIHIEKSGKAAYEISTASSQLNGGIPIYFEQHCLRCHPGKVHVGQYAGTVLISAKAKDVLFNWHNILFFLVTFIITFIALNSYILYKSLKEKLVSPLNHVAENLSHLRVMEDDMFWNRKHHDILEIDQIDELLSKNINMLKNVHEKLDMLFVTEHETGFFHPDRFKEAIKFEIYRSERFDRAFSLVAIKLHKIVTLNPKQAHQDLAEKLNVFAKLINHQIRDSDMPFRINEKLFVILAPETNLEEVQILNERINQIFNRNPEKSDFQFIVRTGFAAYQEEAHNAKELLNLALSRVEPYEEEGQEKTDASSPLT
ncbi:MAG: GGDEF domain-containing protein [Hydrogenovibrio sp.]|nr:GGDEF domain-containing protein [Hydrogenovibrio sp.]